MKKVKILLMSLLVFAVVGGALAFKVKSKFVFDYCTTLARQTAGVAFCTAPDGSGLFCPNLAINRTPTVGGVPVCTTPAPLDLNCLPAAGGRPCINQVTFTVTNI